MIMKTAFYLWTATVTVLWCIILFFLAQAAFAQPQPFRVFATDSNGVAGWYQITDTPLSTALVTLATKTDTTNTATAIANIAFSPTNTATASFPSGAIAATGWTNLWTNSVIVVYRGTNVSGWKKRAAALTATNITYGLMPSGFNTVVLKPGDAIVLSGTSVTGFYDP